MPRGYLKHNKEISKKKARGGSSRKGCVAEKTSEPSRVRGTVEDFALGAPSRCASKSSSSRKSTAEVGECCICFKEGPVVCLSSKCKWHDAACQQCLHRVYVTNAQKSTKCYPLACFHPQCNQPVHAAQLEKHEVFASPEEAKKHHNMLILSKIEKGDGLKTVHCPKCDSPRGVGKLGDKDKTFGCRNCNSRYQVSPYYATIRALENMKSDSCGINDGWAKCPHCSILISKGDGCDHMWCVNCDQEFYWDDAMEEKERIHHARVPEGEIHLWW